MKRILFVAILLLSLMVCVTSPGWASGFDDAQAGITAADKGDNDKAIRLYTKAIASGELSRENLSSVYYNRGIAWDGKGDSDKAIADYTKTIEIDPKNASAYYNRGVAWDDEGDYGKAIADFTKAIELDPKYADAYNSRGVAWANKSDYDKAIADYTKAIELDPKNARAYNNRGDIFYYQTKFREAMADYNKAIENNFEPQDYPYLNLARTASKLSPEEYRKYLDKLYVYVMFQGTKDWIEIVSRYYSGLGPVTDSNVFAEARKGKDQKEIMERLCSAYYYLGEKKFAQGDRKGAAEYFRKSIATKIDYSPEYRSSKAVLKLMGEGRL
jgi:lipoprotein NlpI